jgi:hypothetical protein
VVGDHAGVHGVVVFLSYASLERVPGIYAPFLNEVPGRSEMVVMDQIGPSSILDTASVDPLQEVTGGHEHDIIGDIDRIDGLNMSPTKSQPPRGHVDMSSNGSSQEADLSNTAVPDASAPVRARVFALADDGNWEDLATGVFALADDYVRRYF